MARHRRGLETLPLRGLKLLCLPLALLRHKSLLPAKLDTLEDRRRPLRLHVLELAGVLHRVIVALGIALVDRALAFALEVTQA